MGRNEARVGRLEAHTVMHSSKPYIRVIAEPEESSDDCIRRHGHAPDAPGAHYIVRLIIAPGMGTANERGGGDGQD